MTQIFHLTDWPLERLKQNLKQILWVLTSGFRLNKLTLNNSKTEFMIIGFSYRLANLEDNLEIKLGENNIKLVTSKKSL